MAPSTDPILVGYLELRLAWIGTVSLVAFFVTSVRLLLSPVLETALILARFHFFSRLCPNDGMAFIQKYVLLNRLQLCSGEHRVT